MFEEKAAMLQSEEASFVSSVAVGRSVGAGVGVLAVVGTSVGVGEAASTVTVEVRAGRVPRGNPPGVGVEVADEQAVNAMTRRTIIALKDHFTACMRYSLLLQIFGLRPGIYYLPDLSP